MNLPLPHQPCSDPIGLSLVIKLLKLQDQSLSYASKSRSQEIYPVKVTSRDGHKLLKVGVQQ